MPETFFRDPHSGHLAFLPKLTAVGGQLGEFRSKSGNSLLVTRS